MTFSPSPVDIFTLEGRRFLIKRDDRISPFYSGNKIRKLYGYFSRHDIEHLVSYGGYQSNAMLSMAYFSREKKVPFTYFTKPIPEWVKKLKDGNLYHALNAGMEIREVFHNEYASTVTSLTLRLPGATVVDQGAATPMAEKGVAMLAEELNAYFLSEKLETLTILLPSGTGATALYLAKHVHPAIRVVTTPCVGDESYLKQQWHKLEPDALRYPDIITTAKKHHFAKPYPELWEMWEKLNSTGIEFDLVYAPKTWLAFFENREKFEGERVMYIHTGGVMGNPTQRLRYEQKKIR